MRVLSEGGPAKWLNNKNLQNHLCDYEPGGREFESLRARTRFENQQAIPIACRGRFELDRKQNEFDNLAIGQVGRCVSRRNQARSAEAISSGAPIVQGSVESSDPQYST